MTTCYKEQVLGKRCWIKFQVDNGNEKGGSSSLVPYAGTVKAYKAELRKRRNNNKSIYTQHYIAFDDGESLWFNLQVEESQGRLSWQETTYNNDNTVASASAATRPEGVRSAAIKQEEEVDVQEEEDAKPPAAVQHVGSMNPQTAPAIAVKQEEEEDATDGEEEDSEDSNDDDDGDSEYNDDDEMDGDDDNERTIHPAPIVSSSAAAAAAADSNHKNNRTAAAAAAVSHRVTPDNKPKKKLRQLTMSGDYSWLDDFHHFLTYIPHGPNHTVCSSKKSKSIIMSQVTKLVFGNKGISHSSWQPKGVLFQSDIVKFNNNNNFNILDCDLDAMYQQAVDFEKNHCVQQQQQAQEQQDGKKKTNRTSGRAWILRNPIKKLQYYKAHVLQQQQQR